MAVVALSVSVLAGSCSESAESRGDIYQVIPMSCIGEIPVRATGMAVTPNLIATAAHTFDRAAGVKLRDETGVEMTAEVVYADFDKDIALVTADPPNNHIFERGQPEDGTEVRLISYDNAESGPEVKQGTLLRTVTVTLDGEGRRSALELEADIERGDSGGPVLDGEGQAVGMVFASSRRGERGWAVTFDEIETAIDSYHDGARRPLDVDCDS